MNKYWIPGPITNYGTTVAGFKGEVRVVEAAEFDRYAHANKVQAEEIKEMRERLAIEQRKYESRVEQHEECAARLAEEVENAATYKQERDEIFVNYETVAAQLTEAHRQNADLMAIIDKRDEALGFIPLDKGMDMMDELREVKARLAEAVALLRQISAWQLAIEFEAPELGGAIATLNRIDAFLRPADSASAQEIDAHG